VAATGGTSPALATVVRGRFKSLAGNPMRLGEEFVRLAFFAVRKDARRDHDGGDDKDDCYRDPHQSGCALLVCES
jgi:hypothetical protein